MTLYELRENWHQLLDLAESGDVDPQTIRDTMEAVEGEIEEKLEGYGCIVKQLEADAVSLKTEEDRLAAMRKSIENNIKRVKGAAQDAMIETGITKIKTKLFSMNIQKNPPALVLTDMDKVPECFMVPQPDQPDKAAIKEYLKEHGDQEWAQLQQGESLRIR